MKRDLEKVVRELEHTKSNLDATTKEKERYGKETMIANRRISDIEMLVQRVQEENAILKKELHTSQNKLNNLQKVIERTNANHNKLVNETSMYKENANKLENEVLICKEEANQYSAQVCLLEFSKILMFGVTVV